MKVENDPNFVSNTIAASLVTEYLGINGTYYLDHNRRRPPRRRIPFERQGRSVYYNRSRLLSHLDKRVAGRRTH